MLNLAMLRVQIKRQNFGLWLDLGKAQRGENRKLVQQTPTQRNRAPHARLFDRELPELFVGEAARLPQLSDRFVEQLWVDSLRFGQHVLEEHDVVDEEVFGQLADNVVQLGGFRAAGAYRNNVGSVADYELWGVHVGNVDERTVSYNWKTYKTYAQKKVGNVDMQNASAERNCRGTS